MPKRRNPYADYVPRQTKQHVGFKERATQEEREAVYAKTRALLFQGANPGWQGSQQANGASNGVHLGAASNGVHLGDASNGVHLGGASNGVHLGGASNGVHLGCASNGVHLGGASNGVQLGGSSNGLHQLCITGGLASFIPPGPAQCGAGSGEAGRREGCCSCRRRPAGPSVCLYCEGGVCEGCLRRCSRCGLLFCSLCSVLNYDSAEVLTLCLTCLS